MSKLATKTIARLGGADEIRHFFGLKRACDECPFRLTRKFLRRGKRIEISQQLLNLDMTFLCHKTYNRKDMTKQKHCAGALIVLQKTGHLFHNLMFRLAAKYGFDERRLVLDDKTYTSMRDFIDNGGFDD